MIQCHLQNVFLALVIEKCPCKEEREETRIQTVFIYTLWVFFIGHGDCKNFHGVLAAKFEMNAP